MSAYGKQLHALPTRFPPALPSPPSPPLARGRAFAGPDAPLPWPVHPEQTKLNNASPRGVMCLTHRDNMKLLVVATPQRLLCLSPFLHSIAMTFCQQTALTTNWQAPAKPCTPSRSVSHRRPCRSAWQRSSPVDSQRHLHRDRRTDQPGNRAAAFL